MAAAAACLELEGVGGDGVSDRRKGVGRMMMVVGSIELHAAG